MANEDVFLDGYKIGLISSSIWADSKGNRNKKRSISTSLFDKELIAPKFVPVKKQKNIKKEDDAMIDFPSKPAVLEDDDVCKHQNMTNKQPKKKSCNDEPERLARTIFVGNLPLSIKRKDLKRIFKQYGEVESTRLRSVAVPDLKTPKKVAVIKRAFNSNRSNINAYVVFKDKDSVEKAITSNGLKIQDLHIRVDRVDDGAKQYDHKRSIFVGNLKFDMEEKSLNEFFSPCGDVVNIRIIRDSRTGVGKGFGYVLFKDASSVSLAVKMNNSELCGRKIRVQRSHDVSKGPTSKERTANKFGGMQAKEKFYHQRKIFKKFGLSNKNNGTAKVTSKKTYRKRKRKQ